MAAGFRPVERLPADPTTGQPSRIVEWTSDLPSNDVMGIVTDCREKHEPYQAKTPDEIREIYGRWVGEWNCLVDLGYHPVEPPTAEKFAADWRTGPWQPIDGVATDSWSDSQYQQAKASCGLEMYRR